MPKAVRLYVRYVEAENRFVGRAAMYLVFVMMAILFYSAVRKQLTLSALWTLDMAQFVMVAYYLLGGGCSMQLGGQVRMDLLYGGWSERRKAWFDAFTALLLIFHLGVPLCGGLSSSVYALETGARSLSAWRLYMAAIKVIATFSVFMMLPQALAEFFRDSARLRGEELA